MFLDYGFSFELAPPDVALNLINIGWDGDCTGSSTPRLGVIRGVRNVPLRTPPALTGF
jgi:hypothetical protein